MMCFLIRRCIYDSDLGRKNKQSYAVELEKIRNAGRHKVFYLFFMIIILDSNSI